MQFNIRILNRIMSCILNIETSTAVCSVAISNDGECIFNAEDHDGPNHAVKLGTFVDEALSFADSHALPLDAVAVSCGPGSYTGLRIGVSMAKGVCYARNAKLLAVPTLQLLCVPLLLREQITADEALLCPMLDARRMEVYAAFFGNGASKCKTEIVHPNAHFIDNVEPLAKNMTPLAEKAMAEERFEDVAYFVPFYLKDFVAKAAKPLL